MQQIVNESNCPKHPQFKLELLQVKQLQEKRNDSLFICVGCQDEDPNYEQRNYVLIQKIIQQGDSQINPKWPPLNDQKVLENLASEQKIMESQDQIDKRIETFFDDFLSQIAGKINQCKKNLIRHMREFSISDDYIMKQYQQFSKIDQLRQCLMNDKLDFQQKEIFCKGLVEEMEQEKSRNQEEFQRIIYECQSQKEKVNLDHLQPIKDSILALVNDLSIFSFQQSQMNTTLKASKHVNTLMEQIERNNFEYSGQQLNYLRETLNKISPILELVSNIQSPAQQQQNQKVNNILEQIRFCQISGSLKDNLISKQQLNIKVKQTSSDGTQCISNFILKQQMKYIFRFKIDCKFDNKLFGIGLLQNSLVQNQKSKLPIGCCLKYCKSQIQFIEHFGTLKCVKGNHILTQSSDELLELRISLSDYIVELTDYPKQRSLYKTNDEIQFKNKYQNSDDFKLFIFIIGCEIDLTLVDAVEYME